jgi:hypothetical protein
MRNITESHLKQEKEKAKKRHAIVTQRNAANGQTPQADLTRRGAVNGKAAPTDPKPESRCHHQEKDDDLKTYRTATELMSAEFEHQVKHHKDSKFAKTKLAKQLTPGPLGTQIANPLGQVLYRAALLHEAMDYYQEQELLKTYLHHDPPFHPRRTLDQSYYWTLKTTKERDRDQVVYRGTAPKRDDRHDGVHISSGCEQCLADIRKVPRVIMVDQLWLWILNGSKFWRPLHNLTSRCRETNHHVDTIITSFPKRYGRNKPDPSAVHKSIRLRLKSYRKNEIRSVYDLALIIVDQCSRVFFDRRKTADRQPQVMDILASAIGNVVSGHTSSCARYS